MVRVGSCLHQKSHSLVAMMIHTPTVVLIGSVASAPPGPEPQFLVLYNGCDKNSQRCWGNKIHSYIH